MTLHVVIEVREEEPKPGYTTVEVRSLDTEPRRVFMVLGKDQRDSERVREAAAICVTEILAEVLL